MIRWRRGVVTALGRAWAGALALDRQGTRCAYAMTDGGALPLWLGRTVAPLATHGTRRGWS